MTGPSDEGARADLVALSRELGREDRAWAILAEGNTSLDTGDGRMLVKASGASMETAEPGDFVSLSVPEVLALVDASEGGDAEVARLFDRVEAEQGRRPSVEAILHAVCQDVPGVRAVGHTHPVPILSVLSSARASAIVDGSLFPDQIVVLGAAPLLIPYHDPGLVLARVARRLIAEHTETTGAPPTVVYLQNHGLFALGADPAEVVRVTRMAVKSAEVLLGALAAGGPSYLSEADVLRIDTRPDELIRRAALAGSAAGRPAHEETP